MVSVQKLFNGYDSYAHIPAKLIAHSLKVSSHSDHICREEGVKVTKNKKITIIDRTNTIPTNTPRVFHVETTWK